MPHPTTSGGRQSQLRDPDVFAQYTTFMFIPFINHIILELKQRFELHQNLLSYLSILVPLKIVSVDPETIKLESSLEARLRARLLEARA